MSRILTLQSLSKSKFEWLRGSLAICDDVVFGGGLYWLWFATVCEYEVKALTSILPNIVNHHLSWPIAVRVEKNEKIIAKLAWVHGAWFGLALHTMRRVEKVTKSRGTHFFLGVFLTYFLGVLGGFSAPIYGLYAMRRGTSWKEVNKIPATRDPQSAWSPPINNHAWAQFSGWHARSIGWRCHAFMPLLLKVWVKARRHVFRS